MHTSRKRLLIIVGSLLGALVVLIGATFAVTFMGNKALVDGQQVAGFVRIIKDGFVSIAVIDLGDGSLALIDAGNDGEAKALDRELARRKKSRRDIKAVFLTHGHADHTAGLRALLGTRVYGLSAEAALVAGRRKAESPIAALVPLRPTRLEITHPLRDGDAVTLGKRTFKVFSIPGHTRGSAAYYVDGLLFLGDSADASKQGALTPAKFIFSDNTAQNHASLVALEQRMRDEKLPVKQLLFAHTGPLPGLDALTRFARSEEAR